MSHNVLLINKFFYKKGGSETSFFNCAELLEENGHSVAHFSMKHPDNLPSEYEKYFVENIDYFAPKPLLSKIRISGKMLYSLEAGRKLRDLLKNLGKKIDIAHLHNIAHQISPSILPVLKKMRIPVVMTLHDFKLVCGSYSMLNNGVPCESCKDGNYLQILSKKCKGSLTNNLLLTAEMYLHHKVLNIYDKVDLFISPSKFLMNKIMEMGFRGEIVYLPNFIISSQYEPEYSFEEESIVYCGRLSKEKGLDTLIEAVKNINIKLKIIGDGPERKRLEMKVNALKIRNVKFLGYLKGCELVNEIRNSMFMIVPSEWYENNPYSILEAFALGKPVIGANIGGIPELVKDNETGFTFISGNAGDLSGKIKDLLNDKKLISVIGKKARAFVEERFSPESYYRDLMIYYEKAMQNNLNKG